jgi:hypothetical protein
MKNIEKGRILHHTVAVELTSEMIEEVSGARAASCSGTTIIYSTDGTADCRVDSACDC